MNAIKVLFILLWFTNCNAQDKLIIKADSTFNFIDYDFEKVRDIPITYDIPNKGVYINTENFILFGFLEELKEKNETVQPQDGDVLYKYSEQYLSELSLKNALIIHSKWNNKQYLLKRTLYFKKIHPARLKYIGDDSIQSEDFYFGKDGWDYKQSNNINYSKIEYNHGAFIRANEIREYECLLEFTYPVGIQRKKSVSFIPEYCITKYSYRLVWLNATHINGIPIEEFFEQICEEKVKAKENECN